MTEHLTADVVIVGAGLVGLTAAIMLAQQQKSVVLVETKSAVNVDIKTLKNPPKYALKNKPKNKLKNKLENISTMWDTRVFALTPSTQTWLASMGVWQYVDETRICAINTMQLWAKKNKQTLLLKDSDANIGKLGLIIENSQLMQALWQQLASLDVTVVTDVACHSIENNDEVIKLTLNNANANAMTISAKLLIAADGVHSWVREQAKISVTTKDFNQTAVVANFKAEKPHGNIARQWFNQHDVLALLPLPQQMVSLVWSVSTEKANQLLALMPADLAQCVLEQSEGVLGHLQMQGYAESFVLKQQTANHLMGNRLMLIGDAAHQIHPMAGQGVNLGFRDVIVLQQLTENMHSMMDIGDSSLLRQYARKRKADIASMNMLTSGLDAFFATDKSWLNTLSYWGFKLLDKQAGLKKRLIQHATA